MRQSDGARSASEIPRASKAEIADTIVDRVLGVGSDSGAADALRRWQDFVAKRFPSRDEPLRLVKGPFVPAQSQPVETLQNAFHHG